MKAKGVKGLLKKNYHHDIGGKPKTAGAQRKDLLQNAYNGLQTYEDDRFIDEKDTQEQTAKQAKIEK